MHESELQKHILSTYLIIRYGMALIALFFPALLYLIGLYNGIGLENSMSHYYFAPTIKHDEIIVPVGNIFPMRVWFVGILFALGALFILYRGFSRRENWLLNIAGIAALCVALNPMDLDGTNCLTKFQVFGKSLCISWHGIFAVIVFVCIISVCFFCKEQTLGYLKDKELEKKFRKNYNYIGKIMIFALIAAIVLNTVFKYSWFAFVAESIGVLAFGAFWLVKSKELKRATRDKQILEEYIFLTPAKSEAIAEENDKG